MQQLIEAERSCRRRPRRAGAGGAADASQWLPPAWATRAGEIELAIPKLRRGSYVPSFLEPRAAAPSRRWCATAMNAAIAPFLPYWLSDLVTAEAAAAADQETAGRLAQSIVAWASEEQPQWFTEPVRAIPPVA